jgi:hypothetical protein
MIFRVTDLNRFDLTIGKLTAECSSHGFQQETAGKGILRSPDGGRSTRQVNFLSTLRAHLCCCLQTRGTVAYFVIIEARRLLRTTDRRRCVQRCAGTPNSTTMRISTVRPDTRSHSRQHGRGHIATAKVPHVRISDLLGLRDVSERGRRRKRISRCRSAMVFAEVPEKRQ